jgi:hypothetical protein
MINQQLQQANSNLLVNANHIPALKREWRAKPLGYFSSQNAKTIRVATKPLTKSSGKLNVTMTDVSKPCEIFSSEFLCKIFGSQNPVRSLIERLACLVSNSVTDLLGFFSG